jgi:RNA polymerase sigma-70 factor, ECF subfamily
VHFYSEMLPSILNDMSSSPPKADHADDIALARAACSGERDAERRLIEALMGRVRATAFYLAAGDANAEDDAQVAMLEILRSIGSYRGDSSLVRWADRITVRTVRRHAARRKFRERAFERDANLDFAESPSAAGEVELADRRLRERVAALLARLKPDHRTALVLRLLLGHTVEEISEIMATNRFTVDYRLRRGRAHLRRLMLADPLIREWNGRGR